MKDANSISKNMNTGDTAGNRLLTTGTLTAAATIAAVSIGGYFLWRNREKVMSFLKDAGVPEAWMDGHLGDSIKAEAVKIGGVLKTELKNDLGKLGFSNHSDSDKDSNKNSKSASKKFDPNFSSAV